MDEYRCWHACLERSDRKEWAEHVEEAFGDAHGLSFDEWWEMKRPLFEGPERFAIQVIESAEAYDYWTIGDGSDVAVVINLLTPKNELIAALQKLLDEKHKGKRGRPERDDFSDWRVTGRPNVRAINKALDVWDFHKANPDKVLWQIGLECRVNLAQIPKEGDPTGEQRRVLAATVSRYLKRANELISGVEVGVFPA